MLPSSRQAIPFIGRMLQMWQTFTIDLLRTQQCTSATPSSTAPSMCSKTMVRRLWLSMPPRLASSTTAVCGPSTEPGKGRERLGPVHAGGRHAVQRVVGNHPTIRSTYMYTAGWACTHHHRKTQRAGHALCPLFPTATRSGVPSLLPSPVPRRSGM